MHATSITLPPARPLNSWGDSPPKAQEAVKSGCCSRLSAYLCCFTALAAVVPYESDDERIGRPDFNPEAASQYSRQSYIDLPPSSRHIFREIARQNHCEEAALFLEAFIQLNPADLDSEVGRVRQDWQVRDIYQRMIDPDGAPEHQKVCATGQEIQALTNAMKAGEQLTYGLLESIVQSVERDVSSAGLWARLLQSS